MYAYKKLLAHCLAASGIARCSVIPCDAHAHGSGTEIQQLFEIKLEAQPLGTALGRLSKQTGIQIFAAGELTKSKNAPALAGRMTAEEALNKLLAPSGLSARRTSSGYVVQSGPAPAESKTLPTVNVRASVIPGEPLPAYAGAQVARGGRLGMLGDRDFMDTPFSIVAYTAENMENQQARTLADAVANDASVREVYSSSFPEDAFKIRGFDADVSFNGLYGVLPVMRSSVSFAERVEVLKGPSALLNGMPPNGGVGGNINVVPKRASDTPLTRIAANYASDSEIGTHLDIGRRFGPDNAFGVRLNAIYSNGDSRLEDRSSELSQFALALDYRSDKLRVSVDLGHQKEHIDGNEGSLFGLIGTSVPDAPDASKHIFQPWLFHDNEDYFGAAHIEYDVTPDWTVFAAAGARHNEFEEFYSYGFDLQANGDFDEYTNQAARKYISKTGLVGLKGTIRTGAVKHELVFNASRLHQERWSLWNPVGTAIPSNLYNRTVIAKRDFPDLPEHFGKDQNTVLSTAGVADTMSFAADRVQLTLGIRKQRVDNRSENNDKERYTPALAILVKPQQNLSLYANYIEGLSEGFVVEPPAANQGKSFPPMKTKQIEVGTKADFGRWATTLSAFRIEQPSEITDGNIVTLNGEQRNAGIELSVFGEPWKGLRVLSGITYLRPELVKFETEADEGNDAPGVPRFLANLGVEWDVPGAPGLALNARAVYTGSQYLDSANTQKIPDWTRVDLGARYAARIGGKPVVWRANLENVFDSDYWVNGNLFRGAPRTLLLSATVDF